MNATEIEVCPDCGDQHMGRCGGLSFAARLRSVRLDLSVTESRTLRNYYDHEALDDMFGEDEGTRRERYADETKGMGAVKRKDIATMDPEKLDFYLGSDREEDNA
jgi:hypothetical protein